MANLHQLLKIMVDQGSSDLHITVGAPPQLRIDGSLVPLKTAPLTPADTRQLCYSVLTDAQKQKFETDNELDLSFGVKGLSRFRGNCFMQRGAVAGVFRLIPFEIKSFTDLGLPPVIGSFAERPRGLVLVTGPTGSGKSTTLASILDKINQEKRLHILTIEDPIEYLHPHKNCLVNQREVGADTGGFKTALRYVLRGGIAWRALPHDYPPWQTVYHYFRAWRLDGTWERLNDELRVLVRERAGRHAQPSAGILDACGGRAQRTIRGPTARSS